MSYSVPSSQVKDTLPMPTIPKNRAYHDAIPNTTPQYREQIKETEPNQKSKSSSNSSSSMDSVLSLSDVDFGIREENSVGGDTVGGDTGEKRMSKVSVCSATGIPINMFCLYKLLFAHYRYFDPRGDHYI